MYQVRFYKGNYRSRQWQANNDNCVAYLEHHFNSASSSSANYAVVITGYNASQTSRDWGRWYAQEVAKRFNTSIGGGDGILVGGYRGRGNGNLRHTHMPAILVEPLFASNPIAADIIRSEIGQMELAVILSESIRTFFPQGGTIGFSVGHKYKTSRPSDRGAPLYGGGWEADYAELVLLKAQELLENYTQEQAEQMLQEMQTTEAEHHQICIVQDNQVLWQHELGSSESISWNMDNNELSIKLVIDEDDDVILQNGKLTINLPGSS